MIEYRNTEDAVDALISELTGKTGAEIAGLFDKLSAQGGEDAIKAMELLGTLSQI